MEHTKSFNKETLKEELKYVLRSISEVPNNESPYNYLKGIFEKENNLHYDDFPEIEELLNYLIENDLGGHLPKALLIEIHLKNSKMDKFKEFCDDLSKLDYIRKKYWLWRKDNP